MVDAFNHCKSYLKQYGGHPRAAGFTMLPANYDGFLECFNNYLDLVAGTITIPEDNWELEAGHEELNLDNWRDLEILMPWGQMNQEPTLLIKDTNRSKLLEYVSLDNSGMDIPYSGSGDAVVRWKAPNMVKVLSWKENAT